MFRKILLFLIVFQIVFFKSLYGNQKDLLKKNVINQIKDLNSLEFTFFQKKKRGDQALLVPSVAHASGAQLTAFAARLDIAESTNNKTQRHIAELMILMSDVARTIAEDVSSSTRKRFCWSKWLFYGCLVGSGVGWFSLSPSGHNLLTKLAVFLLG